MKKLVIIIVIALTHFVLPAQDKLAEARAIIKPLLENYPGISVSVGKDQDIVWSEGFGFSDVQKKAHVTNETKFRYYSLSKAITGMALAKLISEGKMQLHAPVKTYLPDLPAHYDQVTIAQLASHTAGVRHYKKNEWLKVSRGNCNSAKEAINVFINDPLTYEPGTSNQYSSFGYVLLSAAIEAVVNKPFHQYVQEMISAIPLAHEIGLDQSAEALKNQSKAYSKWNGKNGKEAEPVNNSCKFGGGGFVGTANALVQLHLYMLNGKLLDQKTTQLYYTSFNKAGGESVNYAFGLGVGTTQDGIPYFSHSGSALGANGVLIIYPQQKVVIALLANLDDDTMNSVAGKIARLFMK